jgi:hypothetical protein
MPDPKAKERETRGHSLNYPHSGTMFSCLEAERSLTLVD